MMDFTQRNNKKILIRTLRRKLGKILQKIFSIIEGNALQKKLEKALAKLK